MERFDYTIQEGHIIRKFCIEGLAQSVPDFISMEQAEELVRDWFPENELAVSSLHRQITHRPIAA